jgi:hypothetical protein
LTPGAFGAIAKFESQRLFVSVLPLPTIKIGARVLSVSENQRGEFFDQTGSFEAIHAYNAKLNHLIICRSMDRIAYF